MFWYLCFVKEPGLVLATDTSKYLQENWFNCYWLETVVSIVIVSFLSSVYVLCENQIVIAVAADDFTEVCMNSLCLYFVWKIIWSLSRNRATWVYFCFNSVVVDYSVLGHIMYFHPNLFLDGFMISSLLPSRPHFVRFFCQGVVTYQ